MYNYVILDIDLPFSIHWHFVHFKEFCYFAHVVHKWIFKEFPPLL